MRHHQSACRRCSECRTRAPPRRQEAVRREAMRRGQRCAALGLLALVQAVSVAQQERDAYRQAYQNWRQADPNLERDAAAGGAALGARADKVAAEAAKYFAARKAYLDAQRTAAEQKSSAIEPL